MAALAGAIAPALHAADGETVYKAKCSACHDSGAGEAPRTAVAADWIDRFAAGRAAMHSAAIRGVPNTAMAPKGGFAELSDDEVRAAVDYMLARTGFSDRGTQARTARSQDGAPPVELGGAAREADESDALLRRVAEAVRDVVAQPGTEIEATGKELVVRGTGIRIGVDEGVVRLLGVAANGAAIKRAEKAARAVSGVRRVENRLIAGGMLDFD